MNTVEIKGNEVYVGTELIATISTKSRKSTAKRRKDEVLTTFVVKTETYTATGPDVGRGPEHTVKSAIVGHWHRTGRTDLVFVRYNHAKTADPIGYLIGDNGANNFIYSEEELNARTAVLF